MFIFHQVVEVVVAEVAVVHHEGALAVVVVTEDLVEEVPEDVVGTEGGVEAP